jgi:hypothetical protein
MMFKSTRNLPPEFFDRLTEDVGGFNNAFEQKEYMEPYVAEEVARAQLAKDPALAREFAERLRSDEKFAADPAARLDFFYRRHSAWDERFRLYPVLRTDVEPAK